MSECEREERGERVWSVSEERGVLVRREERGERRESEECE